MLAILLFFILILNIVSIVLMYYCLGDLSKKEKFIFIAAGTGIMYILTSIVYWISTNKIEITEVSETGKNLITFLFVPVNAIVVLPIIAKSYAKTKYRKLSNDVFFKRGIVLAVLLLIVLIVECNYFKSIQQQVVDLIKQNSITNQQSYSNENNVNYITNNIENEISNGIDNINVVEGNNMIINSEIVTNNIK